MDFVKMVHVGNDVELNVPSQDVTKLKARGWTVKESSSTGTKNTPDTNDKKTTSSDAESTNTDTSSENAEETAKTKKQKK